MKFTARTVYFPSFSVTPKFIILFWLVSVTALAKVPATTDKNNVVQQGMDPNRLDLVTQMLQSEVERGAIPNAEVYLYREGKLSWSTRVGYTNIEKKRRLAKNSIFRIFSMTKPITAAAIMLLVEDGRILLEDPISRYLPEFKEMQVITYDDQGKQQDLRPSKNPIRVRDLLTHTDGFTYNFIPSPLSKDYLEKGIEPGNPEPGTDKHTTLASMVRDVATLPLLHDPGHAWAYGIGLDVAGRLIEVVSEKSLDVFFRERLFEPLGMDDTSFFIPKKQTRKARLTTLYSFVQNEDGQLMSPPKLESADDPVESAWGKPPKVLSGGGGLLSTTDDYLQFAGMLLTEGLNLKNSKRILSKHSVKMMMADHMSPVYGLGTIPVFTFLYPDANLFGLGYGLGGAVQTNAARGVTVYSPGSYTWGGAAGTLFWVDPAENMVVIFMTQAIALGQGDPVDRIQSLLANLVYQSLR